MLVGGDLEEDAVANELYTARHAARRDGPHAPLLRRQVRLREDHRRRRLRRLGERRHEPVQRLRALDIGAARVALEEGLEL